MRYGWIVLLPGLALLISGTTSSRAAPARRVAARGDLVKVLADIAVEMKRMRAATSALGTRSAPRRKRVCVKRRGLRCVKWAMPVLKPRKIPAVEVRLLKLLQRAIALGVKGETRVTILFNIGHLYWKHDHLAKALPYLEKVAGPHAGDLATVARTAALRIIETLTVMRRFRERGAAVGRFMVSKILMADPTFARTLRQLQLKVSWADADGFRKANKYGRCGALFDSMARKYPKSQYADTFLWNAAACYEAGGKLYEAIRLRISIVKRFPRSRHRPLALYYLAGNYHNLATMEEAAGYYELFFRLYPNRKEAREALMWAIVLRAGLGQGRRVLRNVSLFIRKWRNRRRKLVAKAAWLLVKYYEGRGYAARHQTRLLEYVSKYAKSGDVDKHLEALVRLGEIYWKKSCKVSQTDGLCVRIRYVKQRGKKKRRVVRYLVRNKRAVATAKRYFARALAVWRNGRALLKIPRHAAARKEMINNARHRAAHAQFMQAEFEFELEGYLRSAIPRGLDFNPKFAQKAKRSQKRFGTWLANKLTFSQKLIKEYVSVVTRIRVREQGKKRGDAHWSIAAIARTGTVYHNFGERLLHQPIPKFLKSIGGREDYQRHMSKVATPLIDKARTRWTLCVRIARNLRWFNTWSGLCNRSLNELAPDKYPIGRERRPSPGYHRTTIDKAGFQ